MKATLAQRIALTEQHMNASASAAEHYREMWSRYGQPEAAANMRRYQRYVTDMNRVLVSLQGQVNA